MSGNGATKRNHRVASRGAVRLDFQWFASRTPAGAASDRRNWISCTRAWGALPGYVRICRSRITAGEEERLRKGDEIIQPA